MILYIDTSKPETKIALYNKGELLAENEWLSAKNQSEELLLEIDNLLKNNSLKKTDLTKILIVDGPGSYTGLRVGLSTANALAMSLNIEIVGISSSLNYKKFVKESVRANNKFTGAVMPTYLYPPKITTKKN